MNVDLEEFRSAFVAEAEEHLTAVQGLLLTVERSLRDGRGAQRELRELLRLLHTVKGLSAMVGVEPVVVIAHAMEDVLRDAERGGGVAEERTIEVLLGGAKAIQSRVRQVSKGEPVTPAAADLLAALEHLEPPAPASTHGFVIDNPIVTKLGASELQQLRDGAKAGRRAVRVDFTPSAEKAVAGLSITNVRERVSVHAEIVKVVPLTGGVGDGLVFALVLLTNATDALIAGAAGVDPSDVHELVGATPEPMSLPIPVLDFAVEADDDDATHERGSVLRVEVGRVDAAIEMLGSLVVTRSRMALSVDRLDAKGADTRELRAIMNDHARQLRELRAAILRVRMVPMTAVVERLPLVVRGLARTNGKKVRIDLDVGSAELDKTVAERLFPALVHLVRNAVDHGIESPVDRVRVGKPETATLRLRGRTHDRLVELRIQDDGRGVDAAAVAARAGVPVPTSAVELLALLCRAGLSTRIAADTTSGRGLGMDIVRKTIQRLGGDLSLETTPGVGTTFVLRVPLTVAIVEAFTVRSGGERFAVPVPIVEEVLELAAERVVLGPRAERLLAHRGETVPLFDLAERLFLPATQAPQALVVRGSRGELVAYAVERVLGQQEIVVRPIADPLVATGACSGSTDLGDGRVTVVLDLLALAGRAA